MSNEIPNIFFESKNNLSSGIDILTIENLKKKAQVLNHNPEKAHQIKFNLIVYYTHGKTKQLVDFVWHDIQENNLMHLSKGQINAFQFNESTKGFVILFTDHYLQQQLNRLPENTVNRMFNPHLFSPKIQMPKDSNIINYVSLFFDEFHKQNEYQSSVCDALFTIIFSKLEALKGFQTFHIKKTEKLVTFLRFKDLVSTHFTKSRNADFYASKLNITYKHLNNICKSLLHITAKTFIDEFIILEAKRRLINSTVKSNELAYQLGFNEPTNFIKYFKKFTGLTPNSFKNNFK